MADRSGDWIAQTERDLEAARSQATAAFHEWACFVAQQAVEKAAKAVLQRWDAESWSHSVSKLCVAISEGTPSDYITTEDAADATSCAEEIIRFCNGLLAR